MGNLAKPIAALTARLAFHCGEDELLAGWKLNTDPAAAISGQKDLPSLRLRLPAPSETYGAVDIVQSLTVGLVVSTSREVSNALAEHLKAVEKVLDAIDTDEDGTPDLGLTYKDVGEARPSPSLRLPLTVKAGQQYTLDLSLNTELTLTMEARPSARGFRRATR